MPASLEHSPWDFSEALELLNGCPGQEPSVKDHADAQSAPQIRPGSNLARKISGLGDFTKIWEFLETSGAAVKSDTNSSVPSLSQSPPDTDQQANNTPNPNLPPAPPVKDEAYASDGAVYITTGKNVRWKEEPDVLEPSDEPYTPTSEDGPELGTPLSAKKTKKQKKAEKRARQEEKKTKAKIQMSSRKATSDVESESEIRKLKKPSPAKKASVHNKPQKTRSNSDSKIRSKDGTSSTPIITVAKEKKKFEQATTQNNTPSKAQPQSHSLFGDQLVPASILPEPRRPKNDTVLKSPQAQYPETLPPHLSVVTTPQPVKGQVPTLFSLQRQQFDWQHFEQPALPNFIVSNPQVLNYTTSQTSVHGASFLEHQLYTHNPAGGHHQTFSNAQFPYGLYPISQSSLHFAPFYPVAPLTNFTSRPPKTFTIREKEDRDLQLLLRLVHDFGEDKKWLTKPVHLADHTSSPSGIHVFVDFSNIWIGFMEHLKLLQNSLKQRIPHQNISFDSLVLLLERRRPVAKRVLAGSYPLLPAMELAKAIGYETNILDKVYKARELTEKQKRFQVLNALRRGNSAPVLPGDAMGVNSGLVANSNMNSGSGTWDASTATANGLAGASALNGTVSNIQTPASNTVQLSPEKWVEQGVDEILHLKILESIVDTDEPSTMVVATGDAAKAEYSEGFMKMILRALKKGWRVELVAWSKSISFEYQKYEFRQAWADTGRFRIIELDEYAEFLLDT